MKEKTISWRFMKRYEAMKKGNGSGRAIIATARKMATVIWHMLIKDVEFDIGLMVGQKPAKKTESMCALVAASKQALLEIRKESVVIEGKKKSNGAKKLRGLVLPAKKD